MTIRPAYMLLLAMSLVRCAGPCENEGSLKELARESVSSKLKAPASAQFSAEKVLPSKDGKGLLVEGAVDAENAFGAMLREEYTVHVKCKDGQPFIAYAWMGNTFWGSEHEAEVDSIMLRNAAGARDSIIRLMEAESEVDSILSR